MLAYGHFLIEYEDSPYVQSAIIGVLYPGIVVGYKLFLLGKYGGSFFFGDAVHLNEEWYSGDTKKMAYSSIVRSIHGMYFPQSVGLFLLYFSSQESFILTCLVRIFWNAVVKVVSFYVDEQQAIMIAKQDGVYDKDDKQGKGKPEDKDGPWVGAEKKATSKKPQLRHTSTVSQEAAKKESLFGQINDYGSSSPTTSPKQPSPNSKLMTSILSGINSDYVSNVKPSVSIANDSIMDKAAIFASSSLSMVPIMSTLTIGNTKLPQLDNTKLAAFITAVKDIDEHTGWKAVGKSTHGARTWIKEESRDSRQHNFLANLTESRKVTVKVRACESRSDEVRKRCQLLTPF